MERVDDIKRWIGSIAILVLVLGLFETSVHAQKLTDTLDGNLSESLSFTITPGLSNAPISRRVRFRIRSGQVLGYALNASATTSFVPSSPTDGGQTVSARDIGVGVTGMDTTGMLVMQPRLDKVSAGFDYDPGAVTATNGLTPYTGMNSGQATLADIVNNPNITLLQGPMIAPGEQLLPDNHIVVTLTFAIVPQHFTPGTFTINLTLNLNPGLLGAAGIHQSQPMKSKKEYSHEEENSIACFVPDAGRERVQPILWNDRRFRI